MLTQHEVKAVFGYLLMTVRLVGDGATRPPVVFMSALKWTAAFPYSGFFKVCGRYLNYRFFQRLYFNQAKEIVAERKVAISVP